MENRKVSSEMFDRSPPTATIGNDLLPFETSHLTKFFQRKAEVELNDTPKRRTQGLMQIKEMIKSEKCLKDLNFSDDYLLMFLRIRKFDVTKALSNLKSFILFKEKYPDIFRNFHFESAVKTVTHKLASMLPYRCQDGCAILLVEVEHWYPDLFSLEELKRMYAILLMQSARNIVTQVNGFKVIINFKSNFQHLRYCTPQNVFLLSSAIQDCVPARFKGIHMVNESLVMKAIWIIIKQLLPEKLIKRIYFHSSYKTLLNYFPKATLPVYYGGTLENYDMTDWLRKVMQPEELVAMLGGKQPDGSTTT